MTGAAAGVGTAVGAAAGATAGSVGAAFGLRVRVPARVRVSRDFLGAAASESAPADGESPSDLGGSAMEGFGSVAPGVRRAARSEVSASAGQHVYQAVHLSLEKCGGAVVPEDKVGQLDFARQRQLL